MSTLLTASPAAVSTDSDSFQRYYEEAGPDYAAWSPHFNMHFGFFRWGMNPLAREAMLEQMNQEILDRLHLGRESNSDSARVLDMGCGLSATLRSIARRLPAADLHGITLVPWQLEQGCNLNQSCAEASRITLTLGDYEHTSCPPSYFDAVYAIESSCYAHGASPSSVSRRAHRCCRRLPWPGSTARSAEAHPPQAL